MVIDIDKSVVVHNHKPGANFKLVLPREVPSLQAEFAKKETEAPKDSCSSAKENKTAPSIEPLDLKSPEISFDDDVPGTPYTAKSMLRVSKT